MAFYPPTFPGQIWDGTTPTRNCRFNERGADHEDWDQLVAEIIAIQSEMISSMAGGRLTVVSGNPVPITDQPSKTIVFYTPYIDNSIGLWNGHRFQRVEFIEPSIVVPINGNFDIFAYLDNKGKVALESILWFNDSTRAISLTRQNGILIKNGDITRRYIGTGRGENGNIEDTAKNRLLYNFYNQVQRPIAHKTAIETHTYNNTTIRPVENDINNSIAVLVGLTNVVVKISAFVATNKAKFPTMGIGFNQSSAYDSLQTGASLINKGTQIFCRIVNAPIIGYNRYFWLEACGSNKVVEFTTGGTAGFGGMTGSINQ